jgi:hypothetical protein
MQDIGFIKANAAFLQLLEIGNVMEALENIILEFPHVGLLFGTNFS